MKPYRRYRPVVDLDTGKVYRSISSAAEAFGVRPTSMHKSIKYGQSIKKHHFDYATKEALQKITVKLDTKEMVDFYLERKMKEYEKINELQEICTEISKELDFWGGLQNG